MSELDDAIAMLERAVARLEAVPPPVDRAAQAQTAEIAEQLSARVDAALARIDKLLAKEG
jgi:hypothetical protein